MQEIKLLRKIEASNRDNIKMLSLVSSIALEKKNHMSRMWAASISIHRRKIFTGKKDVSEENKSILGYGKVTWLENPIKQQGLSY